MQALNKTFDISLNTKIKGTQPTSIFVNQGDVRSIIFNFRILEETSELDYNLVQTAMIFLAKPDGTRVQQTLQSQGGGGYTVLISQQAVAVVGTVTGFVALYGHIGERITTLPFTFLVGTDIISRHIIESTTEFDALQRAIALLEGTMRLYEDFPRLKVLGYFEFEHELLATFPDGSNLGGGFWVGDEYEGKYYFWDRQHNQWQGIDPNRGRTGDHFIPIDEPKTAQELHTMGIRVGDSIVITAEPNTSDIGIVVAGRMRYAGTVIRRIGATHVDSSFIEMKSLRGLIGPPGEHNPRGNWSADVTDYKRFDTVVFEGGTYNTYMYYSRTPNLQDSPEFAGQEGNPWMIWGARGENGEAATIEISETKTTPSDQPARLEPIGTPTHANYILHVPHGKAASIRFRNTFSVEDEADVKTVLVGKEETETEVIFIFDIYIQRGEKGEAQGTMNHAELDSLDFESSGHTGFASASDVLDEIANMEVQLSQLRASVEQSLTDITPASIGAEPAFEKNNAFNTQFGTSMPTQVSISAPSLGTSNNVARHDHVHMLPNNVRAQTLSVRATSAGERGGIRCSTQGDIQSILHSVEQGFSVIHVEVPDNTALANLLGHPTQIGNYIVQVFRMHTVGSGTQSMWWAISGYGGMLYSIHDHLRSPNLTITRIF